MPMSLHIATSTSWLSSWFDPSNKFSIETWQIFEYHNIPQKNTYKSGNTGTVLHTTWAIKLKPERKKKKFRPEQDSNHDLCDIGAVFYQLSYHAIWELVKLWVPNIPIEGEESTAPVLQRSWVRIPFRPEFFSGFIFTNTQVVCITATVKHKIHVFLRSSSIWSFIYSFALA